MIAEWKPWNEKRNEKFFSCLENWGVEKEIEGDTLIVDTMGTTWLNQNKNCQEVGYGLHDLEFSFELRTENKKI